MRTTIFTAFAITAATIGAAQAGATLAPRFCAHRACDTLAPERQIALIAYLADAKTFAADDCFKAAHGTGCAVLHGMIVDAGRADTTEKLSRGWDPDLRGALAHLVATQQNFARAVGANEVDQVGPHAGADAILAEQAEKDAFLQTLQRIVSAKAAPYAAVAFVDVDGALNAAYARVMGVPETENLAWGTVDKAGIKRTERAWLVYRDAFVAFADRLGVSSDDVKTELTRRRLVSLEGLLED